MEGFPDGNTDMNGTWTAGALPFCKYGPTFDRCSHQVTNEYMKQCLLLLMDAVRERVNALGLANPLSLLLTPAGEALASLI